MGRVNGMRARLPLWQRRGRVATTKAERLPGGAVSGLRSWYRHCHDVHRMLGLIRELRISCM